MKESKFNIKTKSKIMNHIMDHMPDKWEGLTDDEKLRLLYPSDFSLEAEAKGMETAPIYTDNEDAVTLMVFVNSVYKAVPKSAQINTEFSAKSLPPMFWGKIGVNNIVEQDHRNIKRRMSIDTGFKEFESAKRTLAGIEVVNIIRKGQIADSRKTTFKTFCSLAA